jgi:agmatinase
MGYLQYHAENRDEYGILHIDAHHDLRVAYEGFTYSHASIFYNALTSHACISKLVQVGIRDYCDQEYKYVNSQHGRINVFYDRDIRSRLYRGETWHHLCRDIIACLPQNVHISIDIDGFDPGLCPHTGTPVPGGMAYEEVMYLLNELKKTGRNLIGFDLCEAAPGADGWDANVGTRVLFHLCALAASQAHPPEA